MLKRRIPLVQQMSADDCGASCLAMVLAAFGRHGAAAECRAICGTGRDGASARMLAQAARQFGLRVRGLSLEPTQVAMLHLPAIAHWERRHFVVIERWSPQRVDVIDPALGRRTLTPEQFAAGFSGTVLTFEAGESFVQRSASRMPVALSYLAAMFRENGARAALVQIVLGSLLLQALGLGIPIFTKLIVDHVAPTGATVPLAVIGLAMVVLIVARTVTMFTRTAVTIQLQGRLDAQLTQEFFDRLLGLPFKFFQGRTSGDLLMRLSSNGMIRDMLTTQLLSALLDGPFTLIYAVVLLTIAPTFALLVLGLGALQAILVLLTLRPIQDLSQRGLAARSDEQSCLVELMKGIAQLKASGSEDQAYRRWSELFHRQLGISIERSYFSAKLEIVMGTLRSASPLILLWYGASMVVSGQMPLGTMLALTALASSFLTPFMTLVNNSQQLQTLGAYIDRLSDVLSAEPERRNSARMPERLAGRIDVRGLTFRYSPESPAVIEDVSFSLAPGEKLGIVGATGSGKSTMVMLLLGLYEPTAGEILYDGVPLSELDPRAVRRSCGVVLQDTSLFGGPLRDNILLNCPAAPPEDMVAAARLAGLDAEVERMPMRYETRLAESGGNLSGGQRQRVAIARALASRPSILLLDEASSHLDVESERRLNDNLEQLNCTRVVIAHRLSAVREATQILVLRAGRVIERGTHGDLVALGGQYATLARAQGDVRSESRIVPLAARAPLSQAAGT